MNIDVVYLWCDDSDEQWRNKRLKYQQNIIADKQAICEGRFIQNDELKYSLRSLAKYIPWIHNIFIVSDNQIPKWLNIKHPKIKMIKHEDIIDTKYLPLFNSAAIETCISKIKGLSEYFILMNDDMLFGDKINKNDLLDKNNFPFYRFINYKANKNPTQYEIVTINMYNLNERNFGYPDKLYFPHHNADLYCKSDYEECIKFYPELIEKTLCSRFRNEENWSRVLVQYFALAHKHGTMKIVDDYKSSLWKWLKHYLFNFGHRDSRVISLSANNYDKKMKHYHPKFFCMEDGEKCNNNDRIRAKNYLNKLFPEKCEFEK